MPHSERKTNIVRVWDPLVRVGHWGLVIAFISAYLSGDELKQIHLWAGYTITIILIVRIIWGFIGTRFARFSSFVRGPGQIFSYLRGLREGHATRHLGHNPAGGAMIIALLLTLSATVTSGMVLLAYEDGRGPLSGFIESSDTHTISEHHRGHDDGEEDETEEIWEVAHSLFTYASLGLISLHILGVIVSSRAHHENLVKSMITGKKRQSARD